MDIVTAPSRGDIFPQGVYIPTDDQSYLSNYRNGPPASSFAYTVVSIKKESNFSSYYNKIITYY